jgi:hypothetical protein
VARGLVGLSESVATNSATETNPGMSASHMMRGGAMHPPHLKLTS